MKNQFLQYLVMAFLTLGISAPVKTVAQPPHSKTVVAKKRVFYYYPAQNIYYDVATRRYIIVKSGKWVKVGTLPAWIKPTPAGRVTFYYNGDNIQYYNNIHKAKYKVSPPPHAAAKKTYYYYPAHNIYYYPATKKYITYKSGKWVYVSAVPANFKASPGGKVTFNYAGNDIYKYNKVHQAKYKPMPAPKKPVYKVSPAKYQDNKPVKSHPGKPHPSPQHGKKDK